MSDREKILLVLLPFWTPLIPPMGMASLKGFLQGHGYRVKTVDLNVDDRFKDIYRRYFAVLQEIVPAENRGNFHNVGKDVLQNHSLAYNRATDEKECRDLVRLLIDRTFFCPADDTHIIRLQQIMADFYLALKDYWLSLLERERPSVLGLSVYEGTLPASLFAAKLTRQVCPDIRIVMGGGIFAEQLAPGSPNWEPFQREVTYIDRIVIGEGENLFLKCLKEELPPSRKIYTLQDIGGQTLDLADAVLPDFSDFDLPLYPYLAAYTSRSCPFQCKFCSETVQWGKYRKKGAGQIVSELETLRSRYGGQLFLMCDSLLNPVITPLSRALLKSDLAVYWDGYLRADPEVCDIDKVLLWRQAGYYRARLGIESGSPAVLELMGKKITPERIRQAISNLASTGIKTTTYWVIGYPGETEQAFQETLDLVKALRNDIYEAWCSPFYFYPTGQINSAEWSKKCYPLYPEKYDEMLLIKTWVQDVAPSRAETYQRVRRFVDHCKNLDIPNPFSLHQVYEADRRWKMLHQNAVPSVVDFEKKGETIDESRNIQQLVLATSTQSHEGDFAF